MGDNVKIGNTMYYNARPTGNTAVVEAKENLENKGSEESEQVDK